LIYTVVEPGSSRISEGADLQRHHAAFWPPPDLEGLARFVAESWRDNEAARLGCPVEHDRLLLSGRVDEGWLPEGGRLMPRMRRHLRRAEPIGSVLRLER
jgi:hypothetical protein